jgi:aldehyde dehydrogenase (NAD+)
MQRPLPDWDFHTALGAPKVLSSFIDGRAVLPGLNLLPVEDPATEDEITWFAEAEEDTVAAAVQSAQETFLRHWRHAPPVQRGRLLFAIAAKLRSRAEDLARLESLDTGKPLGQTRTDIETAARYFDYYGGVADKIGGETIPQPESSFTFTLREPIGVVVHVTPWNSPITQMVRGVAPSLAAGNTVVVKPSEIAPISSVVAAALFVEAGLPPGVCNVVLGRGSTTGARLVSDPRVGHVTFTGSVRTGKAIMAMTAQNVVPCNLELGGKSPTLVFPDADLDAAALSAARQVIRNSGQACVATTRILAHADIHDDLVERIGRHVAGLTIGHGLDNRDLGPLASAAQKARVLGYLDGALSDGATVAAGGGMPDVERGHFVMPTILTEVTNDMTVARDEVFGPVQCVLRFESEEEGAAIANDTPYGLAAGIFTRDIARAFRLMRVLEAGQIRINNFAAGGIETPFGGYKQSGIGREKGMEALRHYTQLKTVILDTP